MAAGTLSHIKEVFAEIYVKKKRPNDMAVFTRHDAEGRLHCEVTAYFSPAAVEVAKDFNATPCERPSTNGLGLFAGSEASWPVLFNK